ncbi:uncharacterized protein LOC103708012 [Phoenix dactylifera]|uniref:Uncharacterized protein LOC103708012 n=1 Tax=Phoenix dactylifera TaxID=42345 RepID=A0A8B7C3J6_PHODC|nr:uncharacterized protein LOC103708012 [Phoenix dactylifera]
MASSSGSRKDCPICLEPVKDEAYLDQCFHAFCYQCIAQWLRLVANKHSQPISSIRCPLCKTENFSIVHCFDGESFQRHYVNQDHRKSHLSNVHEFRRQFYKREAGIANNIFDVQQYWKRHKYRQKNIWLQNWLRREIQTLTQEENVDIILHHIHGVIESFLRREEQEGIKAMPEQKREEFRGLLSDAARPFLLGYTERFFSELELFLASGLNIEAYDKVCKQRLGLLSGETRETSEEFCDEYRYLHLLDEDAEKTD